jgi:hypothetical protein
VIWDQDSLLDASKWKEMDNQVDSATGKEIARTEEHVEGQIGANLDSRDHQLHAPYPIILFVSRSQKIQRRVKTHRVLKIFCDFTMDNKLKGKPGMCKTNNNSMRTEMSSSGGVKFG